MAELVKVIKEDLEKQIAKVNDVLSVVKDVLNIKRTVSKSLHDVEKSNAQK